MHSLDATTLLENRRLSLRLHPPLSRRATAAVLLLGGMAACREAPTVPLGDPGPSGDGPVLYNPDWTEATHGRAEPRYDVVFPQDSVGRLDIVMAAAQWQSVVADVSGLWGFGFGGGGGATANTSAEDPKYVDVTVTFGGKQWRHVGFRPKGHTSLLFSWWTGIQKIPFRLHFDRFEDDFPGIQNQRFHGFKELSLAPGFSDPSLLRERLAAELFRMADVPVARTAFYRVYIDFGDGPRYAGLYTMVEVVDDTMVEDWFGEKSGNIYKPQSTWQAFEARDFEKKNHEAEADFADVRAAVDALHSPLHESDPTAWRTGLEATFDVDAFLHWLAVSNAIVNKDSYGIHPRNYYLYHHPVRGLVWIPWDHNLALNGSPGITSGGRRSSDGLSLAMDGVDDDWPLIRFLMDDPVYQARYRAYMETFAADVFTPARTDPLLTKWEALIAPWVLGPNGEQPGFTQLTSPAAFPNGVAELKRHLRDRRDLVARFLAGSN